MAKGDYDRLAALGREDALRNPISVDRGYGLNPDGTARPAPLVVLVDGTLSVGPDLAAVGHDANGSPVE